MTHDPKAPLPDIEEVIESMDKFAAPHMVMALDKVQETIRAHIAALAEANAKLEASNKRLRETLTWDTTTLPDTDRTVMVERESAGFWWGQYIIGGWYLKYGDAWISADDVIAWRELPPSSKAALAQTAADGCLASSTGDGGGNG